LVEADVIAALEARHVEGTESFVIVGGVDETILENIFIEIFVLFKTVGLVRPVDTIQLAVADVGPADTLPTMSRTRNLREPGSMKMKHSYFYNNVCFWHISNDMTIV
jgi:hypothetical protein